MSYDSLYRFLVTRFHRLVAWGESNDQQARFQTMRRKSPPLTLPSSPNHFPRWIVDALCCGPQEATQDSGVTWIPHGRWTTSNKFWSAAGVSAGMDMACAWIDSLIGKEDGERVKAWAEYTSVSLSWSIGVWFCASDFELIGTGWTGTGLRGRMLILGLQSTDFEQTRVSQ